MIDNITLQLFTYGTNMVLSVAALVLYGGWLWRIRKSIPQIRGTVWVIIGVMAHVGGVLVNEAYWAWVKGGVHFGLIDPSWLASSGFAAKTVFMAANFAVIYSYVQARRN